VQPPESLGAWLTLGEKFMVRCNKDIAMHKICLYIAIIHERDGFPVEAAATAKDGKLSRTKTADTIEFPSFDASKATDQIRAFAEKGVEQSKEAYAKLKTGAEDTQKALESTFETAKTVSSDLSLKTIAALRANTEAGLSHFEALIGAKSLSEVVELQTAFLRKQVEMTVEQAKDFQTVASKAAEDVSKPIKTAFEKAMKEVKAA
jgi:phasin